MLVTIKLDTQLALTFSKSIMKAPEQREICSQRTIKTPESRLCGRSGFFIISFIVSFLVVLTFPLLLTLNN